MNEENSSQILSIEEVDVDGNDDLYVAEPNARGVSSLSSEDLVIAVMGVTGSGKSTFISLLADQVVKVGHSLMSCTTEVGVYSFKYDENRTVYLIDTPGFDDTTRSDTDILKDIAFFLSTVYSNEVKLAGIIHLHRITDPRMGGSALKNLYMLQRLCGDRGLSSVILATTMWGALESTESGKEIGLQREQELRKPKFWGSMIERNSEIVRHDGTVDSARAIIGLLVDRGRDVVLDIQVQLVDENKTLDETSAGRYLHRELLEARKRFEREMADYKESMEVAIQEKDEAMLQALKKERAAAEAKEKARVEDWQRLNITVKQLAQEKDKEYKALFESLEMNQRTSIQLEQERQSQTKMFEARVQSLEKALREGEKRHHAELEKLRINQISQTEEEIARIDRIRLQWEETERHLQSELNKAKWRRRREEDEYRLVLRPEGILSLLFKMTKYLP
ncbi:P-loop containing nucleoside triphosphate hydrolase protein [Xylogone sp. PMI_703]|nr:P-loop containing nucleoside triphosphate hydrolase protein [Xylogone sp. PMI_703]